MTAVLNAVEWLLAAAVLLTPTVLGVLWFRSRFRLRIERRLRANDPLASDAQSEVEEQPLEQRGREDLLPRVMRVRCTKFVSCGWHGKRLVEKLGVQPKPCPRCGKRVST